MADRTLLIRRKVKRMKVNLRKKKGFSLTELLVVIVILGVLVAIAIPKYFSSVDDAKIAVCKANIRSIKSATAVYIAKHPSVDPSTVTYDQIKTSFEDEPKCPYGVAYTFTNGKINVDTHFKAADSSTPWYEVATHVTP